MGVITVRAGLLRHSEARPEYDSRCHSREGRERQPTNVPESCLHCRDHRGRRPQPAETNITGNVSR